MFKPFENRLTDAVEHLIDLQNCYFEPIRFRRTLNATIDCMRNVTFVLQKCGKHLEGFNHWYEVWQETMRSDDILKWLIQSRNRVVKEGDLATYSQATIQIYRDWNKPPISPPTEVSPNLTPKDYAIKISEFVPDFIKTKNALLQIERRWVDKDFPDREIVSLLTHCIDVLLQLANSLSTNFGYSYSQDFLDVVEKRKNFNIDFRTCWLKLHDNEIIQTKHVEIQEDADLLEKTRNRYKPINEEHLTAENFLNIPLHTDFQKMCGGLFQQGLIILRQDAKHVPIAFLIAKDQSTNILYLPMNDDAEKNFQIRDLAEKIRIGKIDAHAVILISEAWMEIMDREDSSDTPCLHEVLALCGVTFEGECFNLHQVFARAEKSIWLTSKAKASVQLSGIMTPIYEVLTR